MAGEGGEGGKGLWLEGRFLQFVWEGALQTWQQLGPDPHLRALDLCAVARLVRHMPRFHVQASDIRPRNWGP